MRRSKWLAVKVAVAIMAMSGALIAPLGVDAAGAATPVTQTLKVLLIGGATTPAWQSALSGEGVPYTLVTPTGAYGAETMTLPTLSSGTTANFDAVVFADSPNAFPAAQLTTLYAFEAQFQIRQIDADTYPIPTSGLTVGTCGVLDGTTPTLNSYGLAGLPALKGPVPMDTGTYGCDATVTAGVPFTTWMTDAAGNELAGVYVHPVTDSQAGVSELEIGFDYLPSSLQWLLLAPGLINWVTQDTHVGLYRNYFGQDIDDNFIADNEWSSIYQCTPAATNPIDFGCPPGVSGNPADTPPDQQMSAADVAYVVAWEAQTGIKLNMEFNGVGACTAPSVAAESSANCTGSITEGGSTYTLPGQVVDTTYPNDQGLINALLANQAAFNWTNHTWSHQFLGCITWQPQPLTSVVANATGGTFTAGTYNYEITAATAYGESVPSTFQGATVTATGSVTLTWPDAPNGSGTTGNAGPTLWQEEAIHSGGTGFWGYNIYRENPGTTTYGYIGQVAEDPTGATTTYTFTDTGAVTPGAGPGSAAGEPTATNPGIDCANGNSSWDPANDPIGMTDVSIDTEIAWDQAFATANGLTNYSPSVVITGEHSGIENPNMPAALSNVGVNVFATDASRQPQQYSLGSGATTAESAPRYPSNIYYNASNWYDQLNEYNTLYLAKGVSMGPANPAGETGRCVDTGETTCLTAPATEATVLASESRIMLSHVLNNDPRVGYAHQSNLISPVSTGYTILSLINSMLSQYSSWTTTPLIQVNDATDASTLQLQSAWATADGTNNVTAVETNGVVTVTNTTGATVNVPITAPTGTTLNGAAFGQSYGGSQSAWTSVTSSGVTLDAPTGLPAAALSAVAVSSTDVFVVGRSPQSALWYQLSTGGGATWSGWQSLATTDAASQPAAVMSGSDLYVFFRATDNELHYFVRTGSTWSSEQNLGGQIAGNPSAAVDGNGLVIVATLNSAGNVFENSLPSGGSWTGWTPLAGVLNGNVCLTTLSGNVYLLGLNGAGLGWTMESTAGTPNTWGSWTNLGGVFATGTTLSGAAYGGTLHVQGINPQGILFDTTGSGTTWSAWTSLGGILAATPSLAAPTSGLFSFDVNEAGLLWDQQDTTSWQGWNPLSGVLEAGPVAVAAGANAFVFGLNSAGNLWYREWNGTLFGAWTNLGGILSTS